MWWNPGPHLRRRIVIESGQHESITRKPNTFFAKDTDVDEFREVLTSKFGSITRAWRMGLDADNSGLLDFREFCSAVKSLGFTGNLRTLWFNLDTDDSGSISLKELDAPAAAALEKFRARSTLSHGSIPNMWRSCLDRDHSKTVSYQEFAAHVGELGYEDDDETWELFCLLIVRPGCTYITLDDILFLQSWEEHKRAQQYRKRLPIGWVNKDPYVHGQPTMPGAADDPEDYAGVVGLDINKQKDDFKAFLVSKYGSLPKAFDAMDTNSSGSLSLVEFQSMVGSVLRYCRTSDAARLFLSFNADSSAKLTWEELGIGPTEWINHRLGQRTLERQRRLRQLENSTAPPGSSPREQEAAVGHAKRVRDAKPRRDIAFGMPLPKGWGFPPDFDPRKAAPFTAR